MPGNYSHTTRTDGTVLTAAIYNADHQNHVNNMTPDGVDDASANLAAMQTLSSPGNVGSEVLATTLRAEITQLRWALADVKGTTHWYSPLNVINVKSKRFGATGNGVTDDTAAIQAAITAATSGSSIYFPPGTYMISSQLNNSTSNICWYGHRGQSILKATAGATFANGAMVLFGYNGSIQVAISNLEVKDLVFDATTRGRAIYNLQVTNGYWHHNTFKNGTGQGISAWSKCVDGVIADNVVTTAGTSAQFGDGIYTEKSIQMQILFNHVSDFTRIGIVSEGDGTDKSFDPFIFGNTITNGHDATMAEFNVGIWCENTNGARIENNKCTNLYNTPGANAPTGIVCSIGHTQNDAIFVIENNLITDVERGIYVNTSTTTGSRISIVGNTIHPGAVHSSYKIGVYVRAGFFVTVARNFFGTNTHSSGGIEGSIVVDLTADIFKCVIEDNDVANITYATDTASVHVYAKNGFDLSNLVVQNQFGRMLMLEPADHISINNCKLNNLSTTYYGIDASSSLRMSNTEWNCAGTPTYFMKPYTSGHYFISGCYFPALGFTIASTGGNFYATFGDCYFGDGSFVTITSAGTLAFARCVMFNYRTYANGSFLLANGGNHTLHLRFSDCDFISSGAEVVTKLSSFQPTTLVVNACTTPAVGFGDLLKTYGAVFTNGNPGTDVIATANLPAAAAAQDGRMIIEDAGAGDRNLILYAGAQRFRIDGGANV